jgi:Protein of unknown function (DUF3306)
MSEFLGRWARRKAAHTKGETVAAEPLVADAVDANASVLATDPLQRMPTEAVETISDALTTDPAGTPPTTPADEIKLPDLKTLTPESDFRPFMQASTDASTRNSALRTLFTDPHFNEMDGLDIYIDDYGKPDPLPEGMLKALNHARVLFNWDENGNEIKAEPTVENGQLQAEQSKVALAESEGDNDSSGAGEAELDEPDSDEPSAQKRVSVEQEAVLEADFLPEIPKTEMNKPS